MYALIILRHRKPPELLTIFRDRNEFVAALGLQEMRTSHGKRRPRRFARCTRFATKANSSARWRRFASSIPMPTMRATC